jgi:hypothetical protein
LTRSGLRHGQGGHEAQDPQARDEPVTRGNVGDVFAHAIILSHLVRSNPSSASWPANDYDKGQGLYRLDGSSI